MKIYKQGKDTLKIPKGATFFIESEDFNSYTVAYFLAKEKATVFKIEQKMVKPKRTIVYKNESDDLLTFYGYRIWRFENAGYTHYEKAQEIKPMSKNDVMREVKKEIPKLKENDEVYIYRVYGVSEQGQTAIKRYIKQGNRLVIGDL